MLVFTLCRVSDHASILEACPSDVILQAAANAEHLCSIMNASRPSVLVVALEFVSEGRDPCDLVMNLHDQYAVPMVFLVGSRFEEFAILLRLARMVKCHAIVRLDGGRLEGAWEAIKDAAQSQLIARILREIRLPELTGDDLLHELELLLTEGEHPQTKSARYGATIRRLNRRLATLGLGSFRVIRRVARVARAYELLQHPGTHVATTAIQVGAGSVDSLIRETTKVTGLPPVEMSRRLSPSELVAAGAAHIRTFASGLR